MKKFQKYCMPIGLALLAITIAIENIIPSTNTVDFIVGFLYGLSIVLNIYYLIGFVKLRKSNTHR